MKMYRLEPEVAGSFGEETQINDQNEVVFLDYKFQGWLGDELLESTPCFIVTEALAASMLEAKLSGFVLEDMTVSMGDEFIELYPSRPLPAFKRLIPAGTAQLQGELFIKCSGVDICLSSKKYLVVSEKALTIMKQHNLLNCDITELNM